MVSATSSATAPAAEVKLQITPSFSYAVDNLSIVKNGSQIYTDTFSQAPIASPDILTNGVPTPIAFITQGSTWTEAAGKAVASSAGVAANPNVAGSAFDIAILNTNTDPTSGLGLKANSTFAVSLLTFDLATPSPNSSYGMELTDGTSNHGVDQLERLIVTRVSGVATVELIQANLTTNTQTVLASHALTPAELSSNNQIEFQFSHAANTTAVTGSFALGSNGVFGPVPRRSPRPRRSSPTASIGRAPMSAPSLPQGVALNIAPGQSPTEGQTLTASAATNDADATLQYQWQSSGDGGTTWTVIPGANSATYVAQDSDQGRSIRVVASIIDPDAACDLSVTSAATGPVAGVPEAPVLGGTTSATVTVSHQLILGATDTVFDGDDTLGNVTITGLPTTLTNFSGGTYTAATGTWTGNAAQFNALSFSSGTTTGTFNLSIAATTTGAEAATTTGTYALTVKPMNVLRRGTVR